MQSMKWHKKNGDAVPNAECSSLKPKAAITFVADATSNSVLFVCRNGTIHITAACRKVKCFTSTWIT